jgi:hypothetical protein
MPENTKFTDGGRVDFASRIDHRRVLPRHVRYRRSNPASAIGLRDPPSY